MDVGRRSWHKQSLVIRVFRVRQITICLTSNFNDSRSPTHHCSIWLIILRVILFIFNLFTSSHFRYVGYRCVLSIARQDFVACGRQFDANRILATKPSATCKTTRSQADLKMGSKWVELTVVKSENLNVSENFKLTVALVKS